MFFVASSQLVFLVVTPSLGGWPAKAKESPIPLGQTNPRRMPTRYFMVSGRANRCYTLLKCDLEVIVARGNLIIPRRNTTTRCIKVFTSFLRDSILSFLSKNKFIESEIQEGFTPRMSGVLEHTSMMSSVIDKARIKQRSVVITLLDLKNAFGEVHHNLIKAVLNHHRVPPIIQALISNLYDNFQTSIITDNVISPAIPVGRGVLQGDCLSPLLFNMCFNTFIQFIKQEKYKQLGFSTHDAIDRLFKPIHWFQFADDAAVFTTDELENQLLLNYFTKWCL